LIIASLSLIVKLTLTALSSPRLILGGVAALAGLNAPYLPIF